MRYALYITAAVLLAAWNLQAATPVVPTDPPPPVELLPTSPPAADEALPPLPATPTQQGVLPPPPLLATIEPPAPGDPLPTLNPASADDRYEITTRNGQTVGITYDVSIPPGGSLGLVVQGADGIVWQRTLTASVESTREQFNIVQGGVYELLIFRQGLDISYSFAWD